MNAIVAIAKNTFREAIPGLAVVVTAQLEMFEPDVSERINSNTSCSPSSITCGLS